jgi:hypothetical protein
VTNATILAPAAPRSVVFAQHAHWATPIAGQKYQERRPRRGYDSSVRGCLVAMLLAIGCYTPIVPLEVPCSASGACPEGQACIAMKCEPALGTLQPDAAVPPEDATMVVDGVVTVLDRDHDGILDVSDNCPDTANTDQFNEDGDRFGDACDLCPQLADTASTAPLDMDGDRIGDACDPHPGMKDSVWLFDGFHTHPPGSPTGWPHSLDWAAVGDKLRADATNGDFLTPQFTSPSGNLDNVSVTTFIVAEARTGTDNDHEIGLSMYDAAAQKGVDCELDQDQTHGNNNILWLVGDGNLDKTQGFTWATGTEYRLTMSRQGTTYTCSVVAAAGGTPVSINGTSNALVPHSVDVFAYGVTVQVGSVQIIGTP